jgi:hypothetical protein
MNAREKHISGHLGMMSALISTEHWLGGKIPGEKIPGEKMLIVFPSS